MPKFLPDANGAPGRRNDVRCVSLEHKLGIHASPTAVLAFGDEEGAIGFLVGEEHRGMECMFTMMNNARLNVGVQGIAISERAYQQALEYARTRMQGMPVGRDGAAPIIWHPDVRRMLLLMRSRTEAARALAYFTAALLDLADHSPDAAESKRARARAELLVPMVKGWSTDLGVENASLAVQVHGGMGFIEETGVAQHYRDVRITPIYEGTNGIQALDLLGRKLVRDQGEAAYRADRGHACNARNGTGAVRRDRRGRGRYQRICWTHGRAIRPARRLVRRRISPLFATVAGGWLMAKAAASHRSGWAVVKAIRASSRPSCNQRSSSPTMCCRRRLGCSPPSSTAHPSRRSIPTCCEAEEARIRRQTCHTA